LEPFAFQTLREDIAAWNEGPARERWLRLADLLIKSSADFSEITEPNQRQQILSAARAQLSRLGAERKPGQRSLYAAVNPIAEECFRDCEFVRENFSYQKFDEFTFPSADLQLATKSLDAISRGEYRWIVSELHPAAAALHHCMYWSCPDHDALSRALQSSTSGKPFFHFGFFAADFTAHTTVRIFDALPQQAVFASPQRGNPRWHSVLPAQTEVFIEQDDDVALRANGQYLGSFARNWIIPLGFHPFQFGF